MGIYDPLNIWLAGQPACLNYVRATFEQIENVLGFTLPPTTRQRPQWWENNSTQHSHARSWLLAGFRTKQVDVSNAALCFRRVP